MIALPMISCLCAMLIAVASSGWIRPRDRLGKPFWAVALILILSALIWPAIFLLQPSDPDGFNLLTLVPALLFFAPIAVGWLVGAVVVLLVKAVRARAS